MCLEAFRISFHSLYKFFVQIIFQPRRVIVPEKILLQASPVGQSLVDRQTLMVQTSEFYPFKPKSLYC